MPRINYNVFKDIDWTGLYGNVKEAIPKNVLVPQGQSVILKAFVDSDHVDNQLMRWSRTGYLLYMMTAPIQWYSKKHGSIESSTFGSEFVAMKSLSEANRGLRYKLRMMGVEVNRPTYVFGDNQ